MAETMSLCIMCGTDFENEERITWDTEPDAVRKNGDAPIFGRCDTCKEYKSRSLGTNCSSSRGVYLYEELCNPPK